MSTATERAITLQLPNHGVEIVIRGDDDRIEHTLKTLTRDDQLFRGALVREAAEALESIDSPFTFHNVGGGSYDVRYNGDDVAVAAFNDQSDFSLHFSNVDPDNLAVTDLPWDMLIKALHAKWSYINKRS